MEVKYNIQLLTALKEKGLTQKEFAEIVGDHPTFVSKVVNGWANLDVPRQRLYAKALKKPVKELFA